MFIGLCARTADYLANRAAKRQGYGKVRVFGAVHRVSQSAYWQD